MNRVSKLVRTGTSTNPIYERTVYIDGIFEYHILENGSTYEKNYVHVMDDQSRIATVRIGDQFPDDIADAVTYNLEDQIGSSTVRLNTTGGVIDREEYYPFGDSSLRTFTKKRYRYIGREKDLESGLYYYGARYYSAWTCRFISVDPLSAKYAQLSPYNYSDNNPINDYDIDGMQNNNSEESERSQPIIINANGTRDEKISEILNNLPKNSSAGKKINVEYQGTQDHDIINQTFEYNEKDGVWNLMKGVFKSGLEVDYNISIESTRLQESTKDNPMEKVLGVVDKVLSNKTVEEVSSGGGLASSMIETAASETKKEIISDTKRVNKVIVRNKMNVKLSGAWKKSAKSFSKIANVAKWVGRAFGGVDTFVNIVNAIKVGRDKNASTWKKIGAGLNAVASFASLFIKATPLGFALSLGITVFTSWWNK